MVGPDMIEAAAALVAIDDVDLAKNYYRAVVADFEPIVQLWREHPEEPIAEEDTISLKALLHAYDGLARLEANENYDEKRQRIEEMIQSTQNPSS
jgi:hypothetical protein